MERTDEKKNQLLSRQVSLTERLDKERHLNKMLQQTVEETELKAATAFEGISLASQQQATLVKRSATLSVCWR
jgi:ribosomal protein S3AE